MESKAHMSDAAVAARVRIAGPLYWERWRHAMKSVGYEAEAALLRYNDRFLADGGSVAVLRDQLVTVRSEVDAAIEAVDSFDFIEKLSGGSEELDE